MLHCVKLLIKYFELVAIHFTPEAVYSLIPCPSFQSLVSMGKSLERQMLWPLERWESRPLKCILHLGYSLQSLNLPAELVSFMAFGNSFSFPVLLWSACSPSGMWTTMNLQWCHWYEMLNPHREPFPFQAQTWLCLGTRKVTEFGCDVNVSLNGDFFFPLQVPFL